jgi:2-(1,2-epoxy-1,2-dihydrophenyl)acetyl-CoA isomerase
LSEPILKLERLGAVARLTLNRPSVGNSFDVPLARALMETAIACDEDETVRCVLLTGAGRMFCAGGDVAGFANAGENAAGLIKEITAYLHSAISRFARMPKPLVTAINGPAAGAGFSLALLGDIVLAAKSANFTLAYSAIGLSPDGGATFLLPRLVGLRRAQELILLNTRVTADEAAAMGLITRAVDDAAFEAETLAIAEKLARAPTGALGRARELLLRSYGASLEEQMEVESRAIGESARSAHGREGVAAFLAKRKPDFS